MARIFDALAAVREIAGATPAACAHTNTLDTLGTAPTTDEFTEADGHSARAFLELTLDQRLDVSTQTISATVPVAGASPLSPRSHCRHVCVSVSDLVLCVMRCQARNSRP